MRVLLTGADTPLGKIAAAGLEGEHTLRRVPLAGDGAVDLREPEQVESLLAGIDAVAHLAPYAAPRALAAVPGPEGEKRVLDEAGRGTFVLLHAARKAGVGRFVLVSRLEVMAAYPEECRVDETWAPRPAPDAASLAPYLAELTLREFVRAEPMLGICLRMGELEPERDGTTPADAASAVARALAMDPGERKYRWWLYHLCSTDRYPLGAAAGAPLSFTRAGGT